MLWDRFSGCPTLTPPYHRVPPLESADLATAICALLGHIGPLGPLLASLSALQIDRIEQLPGLTKKKLFLHSC